MGEAIAREDIQMWLERSRLALLVRYCETAV
jgi:hypothetical protein